MADLIPDSGSIKPPPGGGLVPDEGSIQAPEEPGRLEALGRGALQGVSFGFADEAQGALESIFTDKTYQQARDQARQANARAQAAHSGFYGGGEVVGGLASALVPGLGVAEGAGLAGVAGKAALAGGLGGLGGSEATDVGGLARDVGAGALEGGIGGAVAHGAGKVAGRLLSAAPEAAETQALKGLAGADGKAGASLTATKKLMEAPAAAELLHEPIESGKPLTLLNVAHRPAEEVKPLIEALQEKVGREELDPHYLASDKKTGGVSLSDFVRHLDDEASELRKSPLNEAHVTALEETRDSALKAWAPKLAAALDSEEAQNPAVRDAILKAYDTKVPSRDIRQLATELQERGASNVANPAQATQIKRDLGSTVKDFVNGKVEEALGPEQRAALEHSNERMSSLYAFKRAVEEREPKEFGNRLNAQGAGSKLLQGAGLVSGMALAPHTIPGAIAAAAAPALLSKLPVAGRFATAQAAHANQILQQVMRAADQGSPWAQAQIRALRSSPIGAARLAQLTPTIAAPVDQQAETP